MNFLIQTVLIKCNTRRVLYNIVHGVLKPSRTTRTSKNWFYRRSKIQTNILAVKGNFLEIIL